MHCTSSLRKKDMVHILDKISVIVVNCIVGGNKYCGRNMLIEYRWWEGLMIGCHIHFGLRIGIHPKTLKVPTDTSDWCGLGWMDLVVWRHQPDHSAVWVGLAICAGLVWLIGLLCGCWCGSSETVPVTQTLRLPSGIEVSIGHGSITDRAGRHGQLAKGGGLDWASWWRHD